MRCADYPELNGRVVEIVAGPTLFSDESARDNPWYHYTAPWVVAAFPGEASFALRRCLRPIGTGAAVPAERERDAEPHEPAH